MGISKSCKKLAAAMFAVTVMALTAAEGSPPAIMFIIDNSSSMSTQGGAANDIRGNRFRVARDIIDSVYAKVPDAQVGMVVFDAGLFLNSAKVTDPNLVTFTGTPYYKPDSAKEQYMPLLRLNGPAQAGGFYTGAAVPNAIDVYRSMLVVNVSGTSGIRNPTGGANNAIFGSGSGTNVSIAFEAALEQFKKTIIAPANQYIIFLSDGRYEMNVASNMAGGGCSGTDGTTVGNPSIGGGVYGNSARCAKQRDFMTGIIGTQGIPATYTVFLNTDERATMLANRATLDTMTANIKGNQYSETNSTSNIWTADGNDYQGLLTLMMDNIINNIGPVGETFTLTYRAGANGTLLGSASQTVSRDSSGAPVVAVPNAGYSFVMWSDGLKTAARTDAKVASNIDVTAVFAPEGSRVVLYAAGEGGTISGNAAQAIAPGGSGTSVEAVPNAGYVFVSWSDGVKSAARVDGNITSDVIFTANFAKVYRLSYIAGANGTLLGSREQSVAAGSDGTTVVAVPNTGYRFESWSDGVKAAERTDLNVVADITVTAVFGEWKYVLSYSADARYGSILVTGGSVQEYTGRVDPGADGPQLMAAGSGGYTFHHWSDGVTAALRQDLNIQNDIIVQAYFADADGNVSVLPPNRAARAAGQFGIAVNGAGFQIVGTSQATPVRIYDMRGKVLMNRTAMPNERISVSHLARGMYVVKALNNSVRLVR